MAFYSNAGFPIRKSADQWIFAPSRSLSQLITSFVGSWCQGIPLALFIAWPIENSRSLARSRLWIMQASQILWNCNCYPHLFRCCSTIKIKTLSVSFQTLQTSLLPYFTLLNHIVQFSRCSLTWSQISKSNSLGFEIQQQIAVWWARVGSNHRPYDYQSYALASWATGPYWLSLYFSRTAL